jgi:hypothetical protein
MLKRRIDRIGAGLCEAGPGRSAPTARQPGVADPGYKRLRLCAPAAAPKSTLSRAWITSPRPTADATYKLEAPASGSLKPYDSLAGASSLYPDSRGGETSWPHAPRHESDRAPPSDPRPPEHEFDRFPAIQPVVRSIRERRKRRLRALVEAPYNIA